MCDCYWHKCKRCGDTIPVHIGDFNYPREDVEAWCPKHIPKRARGIEVFTRTVIEFDDEKYPIGTKFALRLKGGQLRPSAEDVVINLADVDDDGEWRESQPKPKEVT